MKILRNDPEKRQAGMLRSGLIALGCIFALIVLCYGVVDLWGGLAWRAYRRDTEAHGRSLDFRSYIPKPLPDSENFGATPFVQSWFKKTKNGEKILFDNDTYAQANKILSFSHPPSCRQFMDLAAWDRAFGSVVAHEDQPDKTLTKISISPETYNVDMASRGPAALSVLTALKDDEDVLAELREASALPGARYPVVYNLNDIWQILLPHLAKVKQSCQRLNIRACAELTAGQNEKALDDIKLMLYLADSLKTEPFLISYLVRVACMHIAIDGAIWEGLTERRWNDAQLQRLQALLEPHNFLADIQTTLCAERSATVLTVDLLKKNGLGLFSSFLDDGRRKPSKGQMSALKLLGWILPSGWYDFEKINYCQQHDAEFQGAVDDAAGRVFPAKVKANVEKMEKKRKILGWDGFIHHRIIAGLMLPGLDNIMVKPAAAQTSIDQAVIACALERFRLANNQFPEDLQALVPKFIDHFPKDVITGESCQYHRTDDGRFILYSVGWNEVDDGGIPGREMFDKKEGDWVW